MTTNILIPILEYNNKFDSPDIDSNQYIKMLNDNYYESYHDIDNYMTNGIKNNTFHYRYNNISNYNDNKNIYNYISILCQINDINNKDISKDTFYQYKNTGEMFVLILNFIDNNIDEDVESELILWIKDSININTNNLINDDDKIFYLPKKNLKININDSELLLKDCKILDNYGNINKGIFNFAILVEKII